MDVYFLEAAVPLTKTISATSKEPYPLVKNFTSHQEQINTPLELFKAIQAHSRKGHCLIKGTLTRPLVKEPRAGTTRTDDMTEWMCLDFDRFETASIDDQLTAMGLSDVTYILQYSSSHNLSGTEGTISAHVFILLEEPVHAPTLKAWLMQQNLTLFRGELRMSRDMNQLSWPLDITTCQNDKLLYITTPKFVGMKDPIDNRLQLITRPLPKLPIDRIGERHIDALKNDARAALNELRKAAGLKSRVAGTSWVGTVEVQNKPNAAQVTGIKDCGDFIRLNLNGGDSWAYWHRKEDFELIHDYKSDCWYKTKDLVPGYYSDLLTKRVEANATPTDEGDLILALRDLKTSRYFNGFWNPSTQNLRLYLAKNETQLDHWMKSNGRVLGDFIPVWEIEYDPRADYIVDEDNHRINTFIASEYMSVEPEDNQRWPTIRRIIAHMLGAEKHKELVDHFLNWFAAVFQREHKPLTAWVCHGIEGTGKGYFINKIAKPLLGNHNATSVTISNIEDQFNSWLEGKLLVLIDEVDVDDFKEKGRVSARLRNYITEPTIALRRMQTAAVEVQNYTSFIFSSNRPQPVFIPQSDRRYNVGNFQGVRLNPPDDAAVKAELEAFAQWLANHRVNIKQADTVLHTETREQMKALGVTSIEETARQILTGDLESLWLSRPDEKLLLESGVVNEHTLNAQAYCSLMRRLATEALKDPECRLSRDEIHTILQYNVGNIPRSPNKFTSLLRHNNIHTRRIRKDGQLTYGLEIRWKVPDWMAEELGERKIKLVKGRKSA